ncbi:hypothetical protein C8R43DRAFT_1021445 [Mycena crocata]|nr:hypothetical protein C8R43DRAFT_1021445 [Mycena crocata]
MFLALGAEAPLALGTYSPLLDEIQAAALYSPLSILAQCSHRWKTATFMVDLKCLKHLSAAKGNLTLLEVLNVVGTGGHQVASEVLPIFGVAPMPKEVVFRAPVVKQAIVGAVTGFHLRGPTAARCYNIFSAAAPSLRTEEQLTSPRLYNGK